VEDEDDDTSWKVRRAAVKVLNAVVTSRPEMLTELYTKCGAELVNRFKEREENVRLDIIECFAALVKMTELAEARKGTPTLVNTEQSPAVGLLESMLATVMTASMKQLNGKADKTKSAVFAMLKSLCTVVPSALGAHMTELVPCVCGCLTDKNQSLKLDALTFLRLAMENQAPETLQASMDRIIPLILALVREEWYKIIAEALRVVQVIVTVLRPLDDDSGMFIGDYDYTAHVDPIYEAILVRLEAHDIDQEIKECAIIAVGQLVSTLGDQLTDRLPVVEGLLMERLRNEITRMPTLKAIAMICASPIGIDLTPILNEAIQELSQFLRQQSRPLKQTTLETLMALVKSSATNMTESLFDLILSEAAPLVSDGDLHLTHLSLRLSISVLTVSPSASNTLAQHIMPKCLLIAASPLLQGRALESLLDLLKGLVSLDAPGLTFDELYDLIQSKVNDVEQKQGIANIAHCLATLCVATTEGKRGVTVGSLVEALNGSDEPRRNLALLTIGELGQHRDLTATVDGLQMIVLESFESPSEETKTAAAYALGRMAVGNMACYLPVILESLNANRHHYLLLSALKEVIVLHANTTGLDFGPYIEQVLPHLLKHCESAEEGVRNMVAECLGALITMHPEVIVPALTNLGGGSEGGAPAGSLMRWTIASSLKYCMTGRAPHAILMEHMANFLEMLNDEDLQVRHAALSMCNAAVHHQPNLIISFLDSKIIPVLYETVRLKQERVVDLGPFKQKVDDGLPLRKTALACINTVLDTLPDQMDVGAFMPYLETGLGDKEDVQMLCHQILIKICGYAPGAVLSSLDSLVDPLEKTVTKKVKDGQVGTEVDRANELIRSGLRAVLAISAIDDSAGISRKFWDFVDRIQKREKLAAMVMAIKQEA